MYQITHGTQLYLKKKTLVISNSYVTGRSVLDLATYSLPQSLYFGGEAQWRQTVMNKKEANFK